MDPKFDISVIFPVVWGVWITSWWAASLWSARTERRAGIKAEVSYRIPIMAGAALMILGTRFGAGVWRLWSIGLYSASVCTACVFAGLVFTWWARLHLGRLWSGNITRKVNHHIVDSGPYAIVRHPIYSGLLLALLATATAEATVASMVGFGLLVLGFWVKARIEERWLSKELDEGAYGVYRRHVPMLIPFFPKRR